MVKTVWTCDDCGQNFNSRAARLYHRNHTCIAIKNKEELTEGKTVINTDDAEQPRTEIREASEESTIENKPEPEPEPTRKPQKIDAVERNLIVTETTETDDESVGLFIALLLIPAMLVVGIVVFRDKIIELFGRRPGNGVVA